jgi:hypothetical protein
MGKQMMKKLNRYEFSFEDVFLYFQDNLVNTNTLSSSLIKLINFQTGQFFTLFHEANLEKIKEFRQGGIVSGIKDQIENIVLDKLISDDKLSCIFDDTTSTFKPNYMGRLFQSCGLFYGTEIYYLVTRQIASLNILSRCFFASEAIWHSLCVLTTADLNNISDKKLSLEKMKEICLNATLIIIGAYDGEGYIFWEKK